MNAQEPVSIDHDLVCPFLLRCFWVCNARPNTAREYNTKGQRGEARMPMNEVKIYVWRDTTLRQITELLQDSVPPVRYPDSVLEYGLVYPDKSGLNVLKFAGKVSVHPPKNVPDDGSITLFTLGVEPGDLLDVHVETPSESAGTVRGRAEGGHGRSGMQGGRGRDGQQRQFGLGRKRHWDDR